MSNFDFSSDDVLLDIDAVCTKLSVSRSTLERMRHKKMSTPDNYACNKDDKSSALFSVPFPEPTLSIGRSPRWSARILNEWVEKMKKMKN